MVFKPFTHLARQSFAKTLTHGYAQSVVAATQSSYASSSTPFLGPLGGQASNKFGRPESSRLHSTFLAPSSSAALSSKTEQGLNNNEYHDSGLAAYYDAWQKQQHYRGEHNQWRQFQFAKRIGWKAPLLTSEAKPKEKCKDETNLDPASVPRRERPDRAYSTSALEDIKKVRIELTAAAAAAAEVATASQTNAARLGESNVKSQLSHDGGHGDSAVVPDSSTQAFTQTPGSLQKLDSPSSISSGVTAVASDRSTSFSDLTLQDSPKDVDSDILSQHIDKLYEQQRYAEIPPLFESMLIQGLRPSVKAYNALLAAAIHLPKDKHQVVPKALDVYSDMLRRKVLPDTNFYSTIIRLLSRRALDVFKLKTSLDRTRLRFGGPNEGNRFLFKSNEAEYDILAEDDALTNAIKLFNTSVATSKNRTFSAETYHLLVTASATYNRVDDMIRAYSHMETHGVIPIADMFPPMIKALAASGDLNSAVDCYNEYKSLAIADDAGKLAIISRRDKEVYAAVVNAYAASGRHAGGNRFLSRIIDSFDAVKENRQQQLEVVRSAIVVDGLVQERLDGNSFSEALDIAEDRDLSPHMRGLAMSRICAGAADHNEIEIAARAYYHPASSASGDSAAIVAMLALYIRQGKIDEARDYWATLMSLTPDHAMVEPTTMYAIALIASGHVDEGLMQARQAFTRIRSSEASESMMLGITEEIDEAMEVIGTFLTDKAITPSSQATMSFLRAMMENGGLVSPVAEQLLSGLNAENMMHLSWQDLTLALQVEAETISTDRVVYQNSHPDRFSFLLHWAVANHIPLNKRTSELIDAALEKLLTKKLDLHQLWQNHRQQSSLERSHISASYARVPSPATSTANSYTNTFDPHAATADYKASALIIDLLENTRVKASASLDEALLRFKNVRRAGRHPRYVVYAKLISSAAKEGRASLINDILAMARQDIPLLPQFSVVRQGWSVILDAMVGACLVVGNRPLAMQTHRELLDMGAAPAANTYGLYITTLKDSSETFDEATEAVKIFQRAKSEGVEPSSFLYNALIGKLGKARRIDDCLFYFAEMRNLGIRPTSVTYGTIVNALCRVSDERFAEELFDEMESMPNYKPRPAPYNSLMQFFLTTKRDSDKVLAYYERMRSRGIRPTMHTYKLLIDTYATLEPINLSAAEDVLDTIRASGERPEAVHYASLIHAKGCVLHDMAGARAVFDRVVSEGNVSPQACLYQALFESMVANRCVAQTEPFLEDMSAKKVSMTPYIANTLIHGWATVGDIAKSRAVYDTLGISKREPSTYEAMTRAFLSADDRKNAMDCVHEMLSRGYPTAVSSKILDLLGHGAK